jgi:hypothetical protein
MKWRTALAALAALAGALVGWAGPIGASTHHPPPPTLVLFRPVLCLAPPYDGPANDPQPGATCSPSSELNLKNLDVVPDGNSAAGFTTQSVPPDAPLAGVPSTTPARDKSGATVLLPGSAGLAGVRYVLGPAQMTSRSVARAHALKDQVGGWVVDYTMTRAGAALWDRVANEDFHLQLAVDFDGAVVSDPIIQPTQSNFTSFNGQGEISGGLTRSDAMRLARAL